MKIEGKSETQKQPDGDLSIETYEPQTLVDGKGVIQDIVIGQGRPQMIHIHEEKVRCAMVHCDEGQEWILRFHRMGPDAPIAKGGYQRGQLVGVVDFFNTDSTTPESVLVELRSR